MIFESQKAQRLRGIAAFTATALLIPAMALSSGGSRYAEPPEAYAELVQGLEMSRLVLLAEIAECDSFAWARDSLDTRAYWSEILIEPKLWIKGEASAEDTTSFYETTGRLVGGGRSSGWGPRMPLEVGETYLLFLNDATYMPIEVKLQERDALKVVGDSLHSLVPVVNLPFSHTIGLLQEHADAALQTRNLASRASLVCRGDVLLAKSPRSTSVINMYEGGTASFRLTEVVRQSAGPALQPGTTITVLSTRRSAGVFNTTPILVTDTEALVFLVYEAGQWSLLPTTYAAWTLRGDSAFVLSDAKCNPAGHTVVHELPRALLLSSLGEQNGR